MLDFNVSPVTKKKEDIRNHQNRDNIGRGLLKIGQKKVAGKIYEK